MCKIENRKIIGCKIIKLDILNSGSQPTRDGSRLLRARESTHTAWELIHPGQGLKFKNRFQWESTYSLKETTP